MVLQIFDIAGKLEPDVLYLKLFSSTSTNVGTKSASYRTGIFEVGFYPVSISYERDHWVTFKRIYV